jgi:Sec-independent protein translocase protein TatA
MAHDQGMDIGSGEFLVIAIVLLLVLVPTKVPQLARSLGEAMSELRKAKDGSTESTSANDTDESQPAGLDH